MKVEFHNSELEDMAYDSGYKGKWDAKVVRAYRKTVNFVEQAGDRKDLYAYRALHLEKLKGQRKHQHSMRINDQYRLIVELRSADGRETVTIVDIEDYH